MDPLTSLSLASNILQFIDFTTKLIAVSTRLYKSKSGATPEHLEIEGFAKDLRLRADKLLIPDVSTTRATPAEDSSIRLVAQQCREVADELLAVLDSLKVKSPNAKWQSFCQALRSEWKQDAIDKLNQRLDRLCDQIGHHMNVSFQQKVLTQFYELATENSRLESSRATEIRELRESFQELIQEIKLSREKEGEVRHNDLQRTVLFAHSSNLALTAGRGLEYTAEQLILDELRFEGMDDRLDSAAVAHTHTFSWIYGHEGATVTSPTSKNLARWLASDDPLFWISGKPGSGKSTLMKYISRHSQTFAILKSWAGDHQLISASFFFWAPGRANLQKSQEGLLRSILYQILRQSPSSIRLILPKQWRRVTVADGLRLGSRLELMTVTDLLNAFQKASEYLKDQQVRCCLFIDGLDEYVGKPEDIIQLVNIFRNSSHIKVCASSRPWNEFEKAFGQEVEKKLYMQDLTRSDIASYVTATLQEDSSFQELSDGNLHYANLVQDIVDAAQGVFLWVVLVVRSLLEGITNSDRISDLQRRLRLLPTDLDEYFERILFTVNEFYREETAYTFQVMLASKPSLPLMVFWHIDQEETHPALELPIIPMTEEQLTSRENQMTKRLNARCKGLLETSKTRQSGCIIVNYLHRTLLDFLRTPKAQRLLNYWSSAKPDPNLAICKAMLAHAKSAPLCGVADDSGDYAILGFCMHAQYLGVFGCPAALEIQIFDQIEVVAQYYIAHGRGAGSSSHKVFLEQAAERFLHLYVTAKIYDVSADDCDFLLSDMFKTHVSSFCGQGNYAVKLIRLFLSRARSIPQTWSVFFSIINDEKNLLSPKIYERAEELLEHEVNLGAEYTGSVFGGIYSAADVSKILQEKLSVDEFGSLACLLRQIQMPEAQIHKRHAPPFKPASSLRPPKQLAPRTLLLRNITRKLTRPYEQCVRTIRC